MLTKEIGEVLIKSKNKLQERTNEKFKKQKNVQIISSAKEGREGRSRERFLQ